MTMTSAYSRVFDALTKHLRYQGRSVPISSRDRIATAIVKAIEDGTAERVTDHTPAQIGEPVRFEILPSADGTEWVVSVRRDRTPDTEYDGRGQAETVEIAMGLAVADMTGVEPDTNGPNWGVR
jgi:hypothetical protein